MATEHITEAEWAQELVLLGAARITAQDDQAWAAAAALAYAGKDDTDDFDPLVPHSLSASEEQADAAELIRRIFRW